MKNALPALIAIALFASSSLAQPPSAANKGNAETSPPPPVPPKDSGSNDRTRGQSSLRQVVSFHDGRPVARAIVTASFVGGSSPADTLTAITDARGIFAFDSLAKRTYKIEIAYAGDRSITRRIAVDGPVLGAIVVPAPLLGSRSPWQVGLEAGLTVLCLVLYLLSILYTRWHNIAKSLEVLLLEQLRALDTRLQTEVDDSNPSGVHTLRTTVGELRDEIMSWRRKRGKELFFWSRGRENAAWVAVHEVERQLAAFLSPREQVEPYLRLAHADLRVVNKPGAIAIAEAIEASLKPCVGAEGPMRERNQKALLGRALAVINADRDAGFVTLMEWQNKASWLILTAVIIIAFLAGSVGNAVLFLAGASGGFLGRVMRALRREDLPLDYGASWTTLHLSPLFGALAGWFRIALIVLLEAPELGLLGPAFGLVEWDNAIGPATLSVAFLLGFSERFFDAIVGAVERHARKDEADQKTAFSAGTLVSGTGSSRPSQGRRPEQNAANSAGEQTTEIRPVITAITRQAGPGADALVISGSGFNKSAILKVNDEIHKANVQSAEAINLPLAAEDIQRIEAGDDFVIEITNPDRSSVSTRWPFP